MMNRAVAKAFTRALRPWVVSFVFLASFVFEGRAWAQPAADAIYEDAKDIITELIEQEVATSIAPNLACYSPNGILKYYPDSLQSIYDRNFGALKDVLRRETIALVGNYAFETFRQRRSIPLKEFFPAAPFVPGPPETDPSQKTCADLVRDVGGPSPYQAKIADETRKRNNGRYLPLDACSAVDGASAENDAACLIAKSVIDAASGLPDQAEGSFDRALASLATVSLARQSKSIAKLPGATLRVLSEELRIRLMTGAFPEKSLLGPLAGADVTAAIRLANTERDRLASIISASSPGVRIRAAAIYLLVGKEAVPPAVEITVSHGKTEEHLRVDDVVAYLRSIAPDQLAAQPAEGVGVAVARALLIHESIVAKGTVTVTIQGAGARITVAESEQPAAFTGPGLARLADLYDVAQMENQLDGILASFAHGDPTALAEIEGVVGIVQTLDQLALALKDAGKTTDGGFDLLTMFKNVAHGTLDSSACAPPPPGAPGAPPVMPITLCHIVEETVGLLDPRGDLRSILVAVRDRNHRALAISAISAVFADDVRERICCGKGESCNDSVKLYGRLAKSFVSYVLMPKDDQDAALAARAALKSAAIDAISSIRTKGVVKSHRFSTERFWIPNPSLRASWSSSYRTPGHGNVRYVATADWLTLGGRIANDSMLYFGWSLSLVDFLAPFAELASRDATLTHGDDALIAATAIQPRLSAVFAMPSLTPHLGLTLGVSMRGAGMIATHVLDDQGQGVKDSTGKDEIIYPYTSVFGTPKVRRDRDWGERVLNLSEVSAAVVYAP